jgi:hypothetical protein
MWEQVTKHSYFHLKQTYFGKCTDGEERDRNKEGRREREKDRGREEESEL